MIVMKWFKKNEDVDYFTPTMKSEVKEEITPVNEVQDVIEDLRDPQFFGKIQPLVDDINITDINCNSHSIWLNHINKGRYECEDIQLNSKEIEKIAYKISNVENQQFNVVNPILEADFNDLRLQFTHSSFSTSGTSMSIRKTPCIARINEEKMVKQEYCSKEVIHFFRTSIHSQLNFFIIGK